MLSFGNAAHTQYVTACTSAGATCSSVTSAPRLVWAGRVAGTRARVVRPRCRSPGSRGGRRGEAQDDGETSGRLLPEDRPGELERGWLGVSAIPELPQVPRLLPQPRHERLSDTRAHHLGPLVGADRHVGVLDLPLPELLWRERGGRLLQPVSGPLQQLVRRLAHSCSPCHGLVCWFGCRGSGRRRGITASTRPGIRGGRRRAGRASEA